MGEFSFMICKECGKDKRSGGKGMCDACYKRWLRATYPEKYRAIDKERWPKRRDAQNAKRLHQYYINYEEEIEKRRVYRDANRERIYRQQAEYRDKNREKIRARHREYNRTKRDHKKEMARLRAWVSKQPIEKLRAIWRASSQKRAAQKAKLPATLTEQDWMDILEEHNCSCAYCGTRKELLHQEHKVPLSRGGGYTKENIIPACPSCNSRKGTKTYNEFMLDILHTKPS